MEFATLAIQQNGYANFGDLRGSAGYGIRDNGGTIEAKNSGGSWASLAAGANPNGRYLVQIANAAPVNAQVMASLGTGLVFNTTATGVQSIFGGTSCTNTFPRSLNAAGAATCAKVDVGTDVTGLLAGSAFPVLTGDVTTAGATLATTLSTTGVTPSTYGGTTVIPQITVDAKGRLTAATNVTPQLTLTSTYFSSLDASLLTGVPISGLSGLLPAANFPVLTGDVTTVGGSLATTVAAIGGKAISLNGAFTLAGASAVTLTSTGATSLTLPTSGTLLTTAVTTLSALTSIGTIATGTWHATAVGAAYGGTGLTTLTAHGALVGEGTNPAFVVPGCTTGVLTWAISATDPTCTGSPLLISPGFLISTILGGTGVAGAATTNTSLTKTVTGIADAAATSVLTVTLPNQAQAAVVHIRVLGSLGAGGAIGAFECSATLDGTVVLARTSTTDTVATASSPTLTANSCVVGATTITLAFGVGSVSGAATATQTVPLTVTITKGGGGSGLHQAVIFAEVLNARSSGATIS